uniref:Uncharacterized protein n=1 Tax=Romanomermis culicivorax TaxID=13658 RepID=A0A915KNC1_ROMCU
MLIELKTDRLQAVDTVLLKSNLDKHDVVRGIGKSCRHISRLGKRCYIGDYRRTLLHRGRLLKKHPHQCMSSDNNKKIMRKC